MTKMVLLHLRVWTMKTNRHLPDQEVPLVEFMILVFTRMRGESYRKRLRSLLLYLRDASISSAN